MMILNSKIALLGALFVFIASCQEMCWLKDEELSLNRIDYFGDAIRLDGYYYRVIEQTTRGEPYGSPYFLYRNGVLLDAGGFPLSQQSDFDIDIIERKFEDAYKYSKLSWGVFHIIGDTIKFEKWYASSGGGLPVFIREGIILNDTTFHILKSYKNSEDGVEEVLEEDEMYYFHHLEYKPDSTNTFIE